MYSNADIDPSGTYYNVCIENNGQTVRCDTYLISGSTWVLGTATPHVTVPPLGQNQVILQSFLCPQPVASTTWTCTHNFNDAPVFTQLSDTIGNQVFPDVSNTSNPNVAVFAFLTPQAGNALITHAGSLSITASQPNAVLQNPVAGQVIQGPSLNFATETAGKLNGTVFVDGVQYTTIQSAIAACPTSGCEVVIPSGTYNLSSEVTLATASGGNYKLCGAGSSTILNITGTNKALHITGTAGTTLSRVKVCNMTIQSNSSGTAAAALHLDGIAIFTVEDVNIIGNNKLTYGVLASGGQQGEIRGGSIFLGGSGVAVRAERLSGIDSNGIEIHGVSMSGGGGTSKGFQISQAADTFIHSNHIFGFATCVDIPASGTGPAIIDGNHFEQCNTVGVNYSGTGDVKIINNNFYTTGVPDIIINSGASSSISKNLIQGGITIASGVLDTVVTDNFIQTGSVISDSGTRTVFRENGNNYPRFTAYAPLLAGIRVNQLHCGGVSPIVSSGTQECWNFSSTFGETAWFTHKGAGSTGGFRFYDWNGTTATLRAALDLNGLSLPGSTSGTSVLQAPATGGVTNTLPQVAGPLTVALSATSAIITPGALATDTCNAATTTTVTGATTSMAVVASPGTDIGDGAYWKAWVSGANTVSIKVCVTLALTPNPAAYAIRVIP